MSLAVLYLAAEHAAAGAGGPKKFLLAALGERRDGTLVQAQNGCSRDIQPAHHAEARLCRKLDQGATVWVARVNRRGEWRLARPCPGCLARLRAKHVRLVYYTIRPQEYGVIWL